MEDGISTCVEPLVRAQATHLQESEVWRPFILGPDFSPPNDTLEELGKGGGFSPAKIAAPHTLFVPRPAQLAAATCAGLGTSGKSGAPRDGGAKQAAENPPGA